MIKLQLPNGSVIHSISEIQEIPSRHGSAPFLKRELVLDDSWDDKEGRRHENYVLVEFTGNNVSLLDGYRPGQRVMVDAVVSGRAYNGRIYNSIRGIGISAYQQPQASQQGYGGQQYAPRPYTQDFSGNNPY